MSGEAERFDEWPEDPSRRVEIKWFVHCGSAGVAPDPVFDNEADAIVRYHQEKAVPSYFGAGHRRQVSITKHTTISEDVTPVSNS